MQNCNSHSSIKNLDSGAVAMRFQADELGIFRLLMGYLKEKGLFETLNSLQLEIGEAEVELGNDLLYLQRLVLQGRWDNVLQYIKPFNQRLGERFCELEYIIHRQQFLEALSWQGGGGHRHALLPWKPSRDLAIEVDGDLEIDVVVQLLKSLERLCPSQEFNSLCLCLTLERLRDNPDFTHWSVSQGRLDSFQMMIGIISPKVLRTNDKNENGRRSEGGSGLLSMLAMGLAYQVQTQEKDRAIMRTGATSRGAFFDGSILLADGITVECILKGGQQLPCMTVKDPIRNHLYGQDRSALSSSDMARENVAPEYDHNMERGTSSHPQPYSKVNKERTEKESPKAQVVDVATNRIEAPRGGASSSSSAIIGKDPLNVRGADSDTSPRRHQPRAAPIAWTVETEPMGEKERDSARAREVRASKRMSLGQMRSPAGIVSGSKSDTEIGSEEANGSISAGSAQQMLPRTVAVKHRRDSTGNIGSRQEVTQSHVSDDAAEPQQGGDMQSTVVFESGCPLRCVCMLIDTSEVQAPSSSSWMFALGSNDKSVKAARVTDMAPGQRPSIEIVREFSEVHRGSIYAMDWSNHGGGQAEGGLLATASNDKAVRILNVASGVMTVPMKGHTGTIRSVAFRGRERDQAPLLSSAGAGDNKARIWDVSTGSSHSVLTAHTDAVHGLAWLRGQGEGDGLLLSACEKGTLIAHDLRARSPAWTLDLALNQQLVEGGGSGFCCLAFVPSSMGSNGNRDSLVVAGCTSGYVCVINATQRCITAVHRPHTDDVRSVSVFDEGTSRCGRDTVGLVTTSFDSCGSVWTFNCSQSSFFLEGMMRGHTDKILGVSSNLRNNSLEVLTSGADGKAILWTQNSPGFPHTLK